MQTGNAVNRVILILTVVTVLLSACGDDEYPVTGKVTDKINNSYSIPTHVGNGITINTYITDYIVAVYRDGETIELDVDYDVFGAVEVGQRCVFKSASEVDCDGASSHN